MGHVLPETTARYAHLAEDARVDTTARYAHLDDTQLLDIAERIGALIHAAMEG